MTSRKKALLIGSIAIFAYIINYYLKNMLSVFSPELIASGFDETHLALLSSAYTAFYAIGQLVNGFLGDIFSPKKMVFIGTASAGALTALFPILNNGVLEVICFAVFGFALSMVRGPLMKIISENTEPKQARLICVFFTCAAFIGPLIAGVFAIALDHIIGFIAAGTLAAAIIIVSTLILHKMEKDKIIEYKKQQNEKITLKSILSLFKAEKFLFYILAACLIEISYSSISFWIPTYLTGHLCFDEATAALIFSFISVCRAVMPFATLIIFNLSHERELLMMRISFLITAIMFALCIFVDGKWINITLMIIALMAMSCVSSLVWSIYIPSLGKTGKVSTFNGIINCAGYLASSLSTMLFAAVKPYIGWEGLVLLWAGIGIIGIAASLFVKSNKYHKTEKAQ